MDVTIIGAGVIGLFSALVLTDAGYKVTIVARDMPGDENQNWASPWAGAGISLHPDADAKGQSLQTESFKYYWALAHTDPTSGVQVRKATEFYDNRDDDSKIWYKKVVPEYRRLPSTSLYPGSKVGFTYRTLAVNPGVFLPWLKQKLEARGVRFIRREIKSIGEAKRLARCDVVVHASGLGASYLAGDKGVVAVRGQTMFVETEFDEMAMVQGSHYTYVIPRMFTGGAIVGGVSQEGNLDTAVDERLKLDIVRRVRKLAEGRLDGIDPEKQSTRDIVAFRPGRKGGYRLEAEGDVVHAYGFASLGYVYSYGAALEVRRLVDAVAAGSGMPKSRL